MAEIKIRLYEIDYDTDGEDVELPEEISTTAEEMGWDEDDNIDQFVSENGADFISDQTGWLVNGFLFEIIRK